jgi:hypothetical protein
MAHALETLIGRRDERRILGREYFPFAKKGLLRHGMKASNILGIGM